MSTRTPRDLYSHAKEFAGRDGACSEEDFLKRLRTALELVYDRGDWKGTLEYGRLCCPECCITLPWEWEHVRDAWTDLGENIMVGDGWYSDVPTTGIKGCCGSNCKNLLVPAQTNGVPTVYPTPPGKQFYIQAEWGPVLEKDGSLRSWEDLQKDPITVRGEDRYGNPVTTCVSRECPVAPLPMCRLVDFHKPKTDAPILLYAVHTDGSGRTFLGSYHPNQEGCRLKQYRLNMSPCATSLIVRYKKRLCIPGMDDPLPIDARLDAWIHLLNAATELGHDAEKYLAALALAEESLNEGLENEASEWGKPIAVLTDTDYNLEVEARMPGHYYPGARPMPNRHPGDYVN